MLYSALCIDNTKYFETGTITVRIFEYYGRPRVVRKDEKVVVTGVDDLSTEPDMVKENKDAEKATQESSLTGDFEAVIFAPFGGGRNYGSFVMPQVNEKGVVTFLDGAFSKPMWMGSYFDKVREKDATLKLDDATAVTSAPNDNPDKENIEGDSVNTMLPDENTTMVIRTKHTEFDSGGNKMNWANTDEQTTENLISVSDQRVRVRHFTEWDGTNAQKYQEMMIYKDADNSDKETIVLEVNNIADTKQSWVKITDDSINIVSDNNGDTTIFKLGVSDESDSLYFKDKDDNTIIADSSALFVNGDEDSIVLYSDLKTILEKLMEHIHFGVVPTGGPYTPKKAPLNYKKEMTDMEATLVKSKHE
jgi:hypothetical protein